MRDKDTPIFTKLVEKYLIPATKEVAIHITISYLIELIKTNQSGVHVVFSYLIEMVKMYVGF